MSFVLIKTLKGALGLTGSFVLFSFVFRLCISCYVLLVSLDLVARGINEDKYHFQTPPQLERKKPHLFLCISPEREKMIPGNPQNVAFP